MTSVLIGEHDFKSFQSSGTPVSSTVRKITHAEWTACGDELVFDVEGNGFLKQMVRNIVGACIHLAKKSETPIEDMKFLLDAKDRRQAPAPAPAQGLCLVSVQYPENIEEFCMPLPKKISY